MGRLLGKPSVNGADEVKRNENVDNESLDRLLSVGEPGLETAELRSGNDRTSPGQGTPFSGSKIPWLKRHKISWFGASEDRKSLHYEGQRDRGRKHRR